MSILHKNRNILNQINHLIPNLQKKPTTKTNEKNDKKNYAFNCR
jgi:hypothetical protein